MSGQKKTALSRIRTFAQDLDEQRKKVAPSNTKAEVHTVTAEPVIVPTARPVARTHTKKTAPPVSKVIFPPQEKVETPLHEIEKSFTSPPKTTSPILTHIPAFHELQKELESSLNPEKTDISPFSQSYDKKSSPKLSTNRTLPPPQKDHIALSGGTVITDTKRADFNLFEEIVSSVKEFFQTLSDQFNKPKAPPKYTVAAPERRKGVIQKATSKTGTIFTADNETLKEEIRRRQREQESKSEITWTPNTEVGYPLLENKPSSQPNIRNVAVVYKNETVPRYSEPIPVPQKAEVSEDERRWSETVRVEAPLPKVVIPPQPVVPVVIPPVPPIPPVLPPPPIPVPQPVAPPIQTQPITQPTAPAPLPPIPKPVPRPHVKRAWFPSIRKNLNRLLAQYTNLQTMNTNVVTLTIVGVIAGAIVLIITSQALMAVFTTNVVDGPTVALSPSLITADQNSTILVTPGSVNSIEQLVTAAVGTTGSGITEFRFFDTTETEITPQTLFTIFGFRTNPNFNQSVTALRLLSIDAQHRGFIFEVTDTTTVFGAMLEWESLMYADFGDLLDLSVTQPQDSRFIDRTIGQSDVRVLTVNGQDVLIYGFIDRNLLLITTSKSEFTRVLQSR